MGFLETLAVIMIILKLCGVLGGISWIWVLSPIWIPLLLVFLWVLITLIC